MLLTRGMSEWGRDNAADIAFSDAHVQDIRNMEGHARRQYAQEDASSHMRVIYFDENGGDHAFPPGGKRQAYDGLDQNLKA